MIEEIKNLFEGHRPMPLNLIKFPKKLRILTLAPHPDDFDAIGITMRLFRDDGNPIYVAVVSSSPDGVEDNFCPGASLEVKAQIRQQEQKKSCRFFKLPQSHLSFLRSAEDHTGQPVENSQNLEIIKQCFLSNKPNIVLLPHGNDTNLGHQRTYSMLQKILTQENWPVAVLLNRDPKTIEMRYDLYTSFGPEEAKWKARLLRFHQSQHQRNLNTRGYGFDERILKLNRQTAQQLPIDNMYVEAFELEFWGATNLS